MAVSTFAHDERLESRARKSLGSSSDAIYEMVARAVRSRRIAGDRLVDVGCGQGGLRRFLGDRFSTYCGVDAVRYEGLPADAEFRQADLDRPDWPIEPGIADLVVALETIEHLENPWAFMRDLVRIARPGGWVVVTTPNQLSCLSLATLIVTRRFSAFTDASYPVHRTALLESDLCRMAGACDLEDVAVHYSHSGRLPKTRWHYPGWLARRFPRALSDNLMLIGRRPDA
jgi:2-polyprenyl-3-methyl-5-hydroxy-6-metoxy-1,4-benzoquinol methylase